MRKLVSLIILSYVFIQSAETCTIFSLPNKRHWIGRTFDWGYGHGFLYTNKRNVAKTSLKLLPTDVVSKWTSKFGSVTFNQFGREFPNGGMNEAGFMIDALELKSSIFQQADSRPSFNELQFIQYALDKYSTVEALAQDLKKIRLSPVGSKLHYFACDVSKCMTIEFIEGEVVTRYGNKLVISGLANNTYEEHLAYAKDFITFGGYKPVVLDSKDSLDRFVRSNYNAKFIKNPANPTQELFDILQDVGTLNNRWQLIYNQKEKTISFRTQSQFNKKRKVDLSKIDFACTKSSQYFDLDSEMAGDVNQALLPFDFDVNLQVIKKSVQMQGLPAPLAQRLAFYPSETQCN